MEVIDTMFFIAQDQVPRYQLKDVTYGCIVVDYRPAEYQIAVTLIGSHNLLVTDGIWALD